MHTAKRILLVEDDTDDQDLFQEALERIHPSIKCSIAADGKEALYFMDVRPPFDIIFLDLNMPKMDGFECLRRLKEHPFHRTIPVVVVSTSSRVEDVEKAKHLGAANFFTKPSSFDGLFLQLKGLLAYA